MKNESKKQINGCDWWGTYDGYEVYHNYNKRLPDVEDVVFEQDKILYLNGVAIGKASADGRVLDWHPEKGKKKSKTEKVIFQETKVPVVAGEIVDKVLEEARKRTVEDLVKR